MAQSKKLKNKKKPKGSPPPTKKQKINQEGAAKKKEYTQQAAQPERGQQKGNVKQKIQNIPKNTGKKIESNQNEAISKGAQSPLKEETKIKKRFL